MLMKIILASSLLLQVYAAIMALRLIKVTGKYLAWSLIAAALLLMVVRRLIPLYDLLAGHFLLIITDQNIQILNESIGLILSLFMAIGMTLITPIFLSIKQSKKSLIDTEEKYRSLFNNANDAIYLIEQESLKIVDCNRKALGMLGYKKEELLKLNFDELYPNYEKEILKSNLKELTIEGALQVPLEMHHRKKNDGFIAIEMNAAMLEIKGETLILSVVRDVSERKRHEEKSRLFFQATDNSIEAIVFTNLAKKVIYLNNSFEKLFGYSKEELMGKSVEMIYPEELNKDQLMRLQGNTDGSWAGELTGRRKNGTLFPVLVSSSRIIDERGNIIARMYSHRDITEHKQAEENMLAYTEQLRSLSDHLQTIREEERLLLAREIHDGFGASLTGLKMELMILKRSILECLGKDENDKITEKTQYMSEMIDNTISLMRKLATELRPEILDELGLVEAIKWYIKESEKRSEIKYRVTVYPSNINIDTKLATTLFRIFQELLTNIIRHSKATEVTVFLKEQKNTISLLVRDNGIGIRDEEIKSKKSLGILGMQERAMIFGGKLEIEGIDGEGTTVRVEIPIKNQEPENKNY